MQEPTKRLISYLIFLEKRIVIRRFDSRLEAQKLAFILGQVANKKSLYDDFNFYLKGPYSHKLAVEYFTYKREFEDPTALIKLETTELEALKRVKGFINSLDSQSLEILASLLYLREIDGLDENEAEQKLYGLKPHLSWESIYTGTNNLKILMLTEERRKELMAGIEEDMSAWDRLSDEALAQFS